MLCTDVVSFTFILPGFVQILESFLILKRKEERERERQRDRETDVDVREKH